MKRFIIGAAAVLCFVTAALPAGTVFADSTETESTAIYEEFDRLTDVKYDSGLVKTVEKKSASEGDKTVTYKNSRIKKMVDKAASGKGYVMTLKNPDAVIETGVRGKNRKLLVSWGSESLMIYVNGTGIYSCDPVTRTYTRLIGEDAYYAEDTLNTEFSYYELELGLDSSDVITVNKFKYKGKKYIYEHINSVGFVFDQSEMPVMCMTNDGPFGIRIKYAPAKSDFRVPKDYKNTEKRGEDE